MIKSHLSLHLLIYVLKTHSQMRILRHRGTGARLSKGHFLFPKSHACKTCLGPEN
jgi:hypothetical protein